MKTLRHQCGVTALAYTPDGTTLFSYAGGTVRAWELTTEKEVDVWRDAREVPCANHNLAVSPDGRWILIGSVLCRVGPLPGPDDHLMIHDLHPFDHYWLAWGWTATGLGGGLGAVFSPNSRLIAGGTGKTRVCLWRTGKGSPIGALQHGQLLFNPAFSPDGKTLVAVFSDGARDSGLALWNVKTRTLRQVERVHYDEIEVGSIPLYSPDGQYLVVASGDTIHLHRVRRRMLSWEGILQSPSRKQIQTIAFAPDSRRLLTGGKDNVVRLWDVSARLPIAEWDWKIGEVNKVAFAPDGMTAAAAGSNRLVVVWDMDV